jgi:hypothetical protein
MLQLSLARCRFDGCCFLYNHTCYVQNLHLTCSGEEEGLLEYINRFGSALDK